MRSAVDAGTSVKTWVLMRNTLSFAVVVLIILLAKVKFAISPKHLQQKAMFCNGHRFFRFKLECL
jgi:hypothetical protein